MIPRRTFLKAAAGTGALATLAPLGFLSRLPSVSAAEAAVRRRWSASSRRSSHWCGCSRRRRASACWRRSPARLHRGLSYREVLAPCCSPGCAAFSRALSGLSFNAVLVVNSAHLASLASPDSDRWLPIFWALDQFKSSQAADVREGDWTMAPVDESAVPPSHLARQAFITAMDRWDEAAADAAVAGLARTAGADELFDLFARYGVRDFRDIGHKMIYVSNSFRCLEAIAGRARRAGAPLAGVCPPLSLRRQGKTRRGRSARGPPVRENFIAQKALPEGGPGGQPNAGATGELCKSCAPAPPATWSNLSVKLLKAGAAPRSLFDAISAARASS